MACNLGESVLVAIKNIPDLALRLGTGINISTLSTAVGIPSLDSYSKSLKSLSPSSLINKGKGVVDNTITNTINSTKGNVEAQISGAIDQAIGFSDLSVTKLKSGISSAYKNLKSFNDDFTNCNQQLLNSIEEGGSVIPNEIANIKTESNKSISNLTKNISEREKKKLKESSIERTKKIDKEVKKQNDNLSSVVRKTNKPVTKVKQEQKSKVDIVNNQQNIDTKEIVVLKDDMYTKYGKWRTAKKSNQYNIDLGKPISIPEIEINQLQQAYNKARIAHDTAVYKLELAEKSPQISNVFIHITNGVNYDEEIVEEWHGDPGWDTSKPIELHPTTKLPLLFTMSGWSLYKTTVKSGYEGTSTGTSSEVIQ